MSSLHVPSSLVITGLITERGKGYITSDLASKNLLLDRREKSVTAGGLEP